MVTVWTGLLIVGGGPGALAAAEIASGYRLPSLVVGHEAGKGPNAEFPVALDGGAVAALTPHGVLDVLRPYLAVADPPTLSPHVFEDILKHHCVADMNVTVYDAMEVTDRRPAGAGLRGTLTDGSARWDVEAEAFIDTSGYPDGLSDAVNRAASDVRAVLKRMQAG
ncbi:MAG: hypothetical protein IT196_08730 [Acidimicrobiales bacterium]|nr:hypothetical protein [Acidimicrobiales bacterium]